MFHEMYALPSSVTSSTDGEMLSFESIQLSTQGAERQRKDVVLALINILDSVHLFSVYAHLFLCDSLSSQDYETCTAL